MKLVSTISEIKINDNLLFEKLCIIENFKKIMPENVSKFEILDADTFIFSIKGMPAIKLVIGEKKVPSLITLNSSESKINFSLKAELKKIDEDNCSFSIEFNGDLNPMVQMMVKTPLQSFINDLSANASNLV
tara:strand:- start:757 stop:1152 length:396 start_codon:yes stop_codon:yes gene_type:complete